MVKSSKAVIIRSWVLEIAILYFSPLSTATNAKIALSGIYYHNVSLLATWFVIETHNRVKKIASYIILVAMLFRNSC